MARLMPFLTAMILILPLGVVCSQEPKTEGEILKKLEGAWMRKVKDGEPRLTLVFAKNKVTFNSVGKMFATVSRDCSIIEKGGKKYLEVKKGDEGNLGSMPAFLGVSFPGERLMLQGSIHIAGFGKHDLTGEWQRDK